MVDDRRSGQPDVSWMRTLFLGELTDLGEQGGEPYAGIFTPGYGAEEITLFMTEHYASVDGAKALADTLNMHDFYFQGIAEAAASAGFERTQENMAILEICAGSGSATFPLLDLFPHASICATELSAPMLACLKEKLIAAGLEKRCILMQLNAEDLRFAPASFDLIVGAAALHHLFHPRNTLEQCARILKPGGIAIFFEPFENGMGVIKMIYKTILKDPRSYLIGIRTRLYMLNAVRYWQKMIAQEKKQFFEGTDDKWVFSRQYFYQVAREIGMECLIYPVEKSNRPFETLIKTHTSGNKINNLPKWIWNIVDDFENSFSEDAKKDMLSEGVVILKKNT